MSKIGKVSKSKSSARRLILAASGLAAAGISNYGIFAAAGLAAAGISNHVMAATQYYTLNGTNSGLGNFNGTTQSWEASDWTTSSTGGVATTTFTSGNFPEFSGTGAAWTMTVGATETIAGMEGYAGLSSTNTQVITFNQSGTGNLSIASGLQGFFSESTSGGLLFNVPITGTGGMEQHGNGYIALYGNNTFSGGFETTGGQVTYYNNNNSFGTGTIWFQGTPGWAFLNSATSQLTITNLISITNAGSATENNFATNGSAGDGTLAAPGVIFTGNMLLSATAADVFEMQPGSVGTFTEFKGNITGASGIQILPVANGPSGSFIFADATSGGSTYSGSTYVDAGTVYCGSSNTLSANSAYTVNNNGTNGGILNLNGFNQIIGSLTGSGTVSLGLTTTAALLTTGSNGTSTTFTGGISGTGTGGGLTKIGAGTFTLTHTGGDTYLGPTTIVAGTLAAGAATSFAPASAFTVTSGATLSLAGFNQTIGSLAGAGTVSLGAATDGVLTTGSNNTSTTFSGNITGTGTGGGLTVIGTGTFTLSKTGGDVYNGPTTVSTGVLATGASNALSAASAFTVAAAGTMSLAGFDQTIGSLAGAGTVDIGDTTAANFTTGSNNTSTTFSGSITGTGTGGSLIKIGSGTFSLTSTNGSTFLADTTISAGVLSIVQDNDLGGNATGNVNIGAATLLAAGSFSTSRLIHANNSASTIDVSSGKLFEVTSVIDGSGNLTKGTNTGTLQLDNAGNSFQNLTIKGGVVSVSSDGAMGSSTGAVTLSSGSAGATLLSTGTFSSARSVNLNGTLNIIDATGSNTLDLSGVVSGTGALTKGSNTGTLQLDGANSYQGLFINGGAVSVSSDGNMGSASGAVTLNGGSVGATLLSMGTFSSGRLVNLNGTLNIIDVTGTNTLDLSNVVSGTGGLTKGPNTGTLQLDGANTYQGLFINGGAVSVSSDGNMGSASGAVTLNGGSAGATLLSTGTFSSARLVNLNGTLNIIDVTGTNTLDLSNVVSGTGGLTKGPNTGTLQLDGANSYQGLFINGGAVSVSSDGNMGSASGGVTLMGGSAGATLLSTGTFSSARSVNVNGSLDIIDVTGTNTLDLSGVVGGTDALTKGSNTGTLQLDGANSYQGLFINGGAVSVSSDGNMGSASGAVTLNGGSAGATLLSMGTFSSARTVNLNGSVNVIDATGTNVLTLTGTVGSGDLTKGTNSGTLQLAQSAGFSIAGNINVNGGTLLVGPTGGETGPLSVGNTLTVNSGALAAIATGVSSNSVTNSVSTLTLNGSGQFDLANSNLITSTPSNTIRQYLINGYNGGAWNGTGGISSVNANASYNIPASNGGHFTALGYTSGTSTVGAALGLTAGQTLVKYTIYGDANLDGTVDINDLNIVLSNFLSGNPATWDTGDFFYAGQTDISDLNAVLSNFFDTAPTTVRAANAAAKFKASTASTAKTLTGTVSPADTVSPPPANGVLELVVNTTSGDVELEGNNADIASLQITSASSSIITANWTDLHANGYTNWSDTAKKKTGIGEYDNQFTATGDYAVLGVVDYGDIYNTTVNAEDYVFKYGSVESNDTTVDTDTGSVIYVSGVPEPTTLSLMGLAAAGLMGRRRRRVAKN